MQWTASGAGAAELAARIFEVLHRLFIGGLLLGIEIALRDAEGAIVPKADNDGGGEDRAEDGDEYFHGVSFSISFWCWVS